MAFFAIVGFTVPITPRRFRTTVLMDIYDATKDIKKAQAAAGHTTAAMTLKHYDSCIFWPKA